MSEDKMVRLLAIRYVKESEANVRFYRALGLESSVESRSGDWVELTSGPSILALHVSPGEREHAPVELAFEADESLEAIADRLQAGGFGLVEIVDEDFGRSLTTTDPEGLVVQVNESHPALYT